MTSREGQPAGTSGGPWVASDRPKHSGQENPALRSYRYAKLCAVALASAGVLWAFKAAAIMITGDQPPIAFELGQALFAAGVAGLYFVIDTSRSLARIGLIVAASAFAGLVLAFFYSLIPGAEVSSEEEFLFPYSLLILIGSTGGFLALLLLSVSFFRARYDLGYRRSVPLLVAVLPLPLAVTAILHFEMPIFLIGITWVVLAYFLAWMVSQNVRNTSNPAAATR